MQVTHCPVCGHQLKTAAAIGQRAACKVCLWSGKVLDIDDGTRPAVEVEAEDMPRVCQHTWAEVRESTLAALSDSIRIGQDFEQQGRLSKKAAQTLRRLERIAVKHGR